MEENMNNMNNEVFDVEESTVAEAPEKNGGHELLFGVVGTIVGVLIHKFVIAPWTAKRKARKAAAEEENASEIEVECSEVRDSEE